MGGGRSRLLYFIPALFMGPEEGDNNSQSRELSRVMGMFATANLK